MSVSLKPVQSTLLAAYHRYAQSPEVSILHPLHDGLPPTATAHSTVDAWCAAVGSATAVREAVGGLAIATDAVSVFREWGMELAEDLSPDVVLKYMAAGVNFLVGFFSAPIFQSSTQRTAFLTLIGSVVDTPLKVRWTAWTGRNVLRSDYSAYNIQGAIQRIDLWKFITDRAWRSAKDEPWLLWTQWAPQLFKSTGYEGPTRVLTRDNILTAGNNFSMHWGCFGGTNWRAVSPPMWRFRREHPALDARLREACTRDLLGAQDLLWEAYQILSSPAYDDLRDRDNPHSSYYG